MGRFKPIFLALVLNSVGIYLFTAPKGFSCFPYSSYFIFLLAIFFLLWDVQIKPVGFRKLMYWAEFFLEFIVNMMIMEIIMNNFWFPLEMAFLTFLPKITGCLGKFLKGAGINSTSILKMFEFFKWRGTLWAASHILSIFFFLCIIHATRVVDFRIIKNCGATDFVDDITRRSLAFFCKLTSKPNNCPPPTCPDGGVAMTQHYSLQRDLNAYDDFSSDSEEYCCCDHHACDTRSSSYGSSNL